MPGMVNNTPVEPDDGETWDITAYWNTATAPCQQYTETASVEVSWNGTGWVLTNKTTTTNITAIDVCDLDTCSAEDTHSWGYELRENIVDPVTVGLPVYHLRQVVYTTTAEDDGFELDTANCTLGNAVSPDSASYNATDPGPFECAY
ncbi:MAG: hypothetical protein ACE5E8_06570, partial [Acidimicrobiia bacterium]